MELNENVLNDLMSDVDTNIDEDVDDNEITNEDLLGLDELRNDSKDDNSDSDDNSDENINNNPEESESEKGDFITNYLKEFGIEDPTKIQMEDESGQITEVDFNTLSDDEKLNIFKELSDPGYSDYEKQVIDYLRRNNATLDDVVKYYSDKAIEDYLSEHPEDAHQKVYDIDSYTDDEIYLADLKNKYPDFTDEELTEKLDSAKLNEDLFNKEVQAIRTAQKAYEDEQARQQEELEKQSYQELQQNLQNAMSNFNEILLDPDDPKSDALQIEDSDRAIMLKYLTELGKDGKSQLVKDLEDPNALIEIAYYRTRERDNITGLTRYWKNELANERKEKAKLQKELDKIKNKGKNSFVETPKKDKKTSGKPLGIMDLY
jgi:Skp family chaperone for outer membrane proteins